MSQHVRVRLLARARRDLVSLYIESAARFGPTALGRYRRLIDAAVRDLADDPHRTGVRREDGLLENVYLYHVRHSHARAATRERVARPRHIIAFQLDGSALVIVRILHEAMDLDAQLADEAPRKERE